MRVRPLAFACLAANLAAMGAADTLDLAIQRLLGEHPSVPGLSIAVIENGAIVRAQGYGRTAPDGTAPVTADTLFQAASISKPVTALAALRLVEQGKLSLDADFNETLKSWHLPDSPFTQKEKVTLRRILSHGAGLSVHGFRGYAVGAPVPTPVEILEGRPPANSARIEVTQRPGSQWKYSGGGYVLLQVGMTEATGEAFPKLMKDLVLAPLGMTASGYDQPLPPERAKSAAHGTDADGEIVPGGWHVYPELAPAGLWTTPSDLARYAIGIQALLAGKHPEILSAAMTRAMLTRQTGSFGLGLALAGEGDAANFSHNGRNEGFDSDMVAFETTGQGAVVMINANDDTRLVSRTMAAIGAVYHWPGYSPLAALAPIEDKEPDVTARVRQVITGFQQASLTSEGFGPELWALLDTQQTQGPPPYLAKAGSLKSLSLLRRTEKTGAIVYLYRASFENADQTVTVAIAKDSRIIGLLFKPQ